MAPEVESPVDDDETASTGDLAEDGPPQKFLQRILPQTALGLAGLLFMMSIAAALSGAVLFAFYSVRLQDTRDEVNAVENRIADDLEAATQILDQEKQAAIDEVNAQLDQLEQFAASGETLDALVESAGPSVYFVATLDVDGAPSVGSAFVVASDASQSLLLTSFDTIEAATAEPAPGIELRKGDEVFPARLNGWDESKDLALLIIDRPNLEALPWAEGPPATGDRIFALSGLGAAGGAVSQGSVADVSGNGIQHDAPIGAAFRGGPLLDSRGEVVGLASRAYSPVGFDPLAVFFGVPIRDACAEVLSCPG